MAEVDATRACVVCGNALTSKMDKKCCGADCSAEHRRRWMADRWNKRKPEMSRRQCAHCSAEFLTSHAKQQKYCGSACRGMAAKAQEGEPSRCCVVCGREFARCGHIKFCSDECRGARNRSHQRASALRHGRLKGPQQLTCAHCSASFTGRADQLYCSGKCKDAERRKTPAYAQDQARWRDKNRDSIRARHKQYSSRVRAERGRGDRSGEYANKKARALGVIHAAMLWVDVQYYMAHAEALAMDAEIDRSRRARRKAERAATKELAKKPRPDGAQSAYIVALKANPAAYSKELARWRAKTLKRKTGVVMKSDGTATAAVVLGGSSCLYCDCRLTDTNRSHDHMVPVVMGGVHSAANIAPCCLQCNARKGSKDFMSFVSTLPTKDQRRAIKFYERRNGPVVQMGLCLAA